MRWKSIITGLYEISGKEVPIKKIKFKTELGYSRCPLEDIKFPCEPEQCDDMEILLDFKYKNTLYKMQGDFNLRSKTSVIRHMVRRYFDLYAKHKTEVLLRFVIYSFNLWKRIKAKKTLWPKNPPHIGGQTENYLSKTYTNHLLI